MFNINDQTKPLMSLLLFCMTLTFSSLSAATNIKDVVHEEVTIWSQGVRLAADIYKPKGLTATQKLPEFKKELWPPFCGTWFYCARF